MAVNRERRLVNREVGTLYLDYSSLADAFDEIQQLIKDYGKDAQIIECQHSYSDSKYLAVMVKVPEDDARYNQRIALEEKYAAQQEERDKEDYKRLQKKFGK